MEPGSLCMQRGIATAARTSVKRLQQRGHCAYWCAGTQSLVCQASSAITAQPTAPTVLPQQQRQQQHSRLPHQASNAGTEEASGSYDWRHQWYPVHLARDVPTGQPTRVELFDEAYVLLRRPDGSVMALQDRCPHRAAALSEGRMTEAGDLQCAYHGWSFGPDGSCTNIPQVAGGQVLSGRTCAAAVPVLERQGLVWLWPAPGQEPDSDKRPSVIEELDQPGWVADDFVRDFPVDYSLLLENLADPDHGLWAHQTPAFDSYAASKDHPLEIQEHKSSTSYKAVAEVAAVLKLTGKGDEKTKPLLGEQAASADELKARIVFEAPCFIRWSRHDGSNRTNFISAFYCIPVGIGRTRFVLRYARSIAPWLRLPQWLVAIGVNKFVDQDTYLLATQQPTTLGGEVHDVMQGRAGEQQGREHEGGSEGATAPPMARRSWYCHRSPTDTLLVTLGKWMDAALPCMPNRYAGMASLAAASGVEPHLLFPAPPREQVLDRYMQHTSISQNSMTAMQRFESAALALHDWAILTAVGAAVFAASVLSQPGQQLPLLQLVKMAAVGGSLAALSTLCSSIAGQFRYCHTRKFAAKDLAKLSKLESKAGTSNIVPPRP